MRSITYITNVRMPTEKAHGIQIAKMCEALADNGVELELIVPMRRGADPEKAYDFYGIRRNFTITRLWSFDMVTELPWLGYWLQLATFTLSVIARFMFIPRKGTLLYTREFFLAACLPRMGYETIYEAHRVLSNKRAFFGWLRPVRKFVTNSRGVADEFKANGFPDVLPLSNGIDLSEFTFTASKEQLRNELQLPLNAKLALYTGYLYKWKGIDTLMGAAELLTASGRNDVRIVIVGGSDEDVRTYSKIAADKKLGSIIFLGHKDRKIIPRYLKAADVLLLPNSAVSEESIKYTSPIKLFEYMASGVPVVASDFPSIREILNEGNSVLVKADAAGALIQGIDTVLKDGSFAETISKKAFQDVSALTWDSRAKKIIQFIGL